MKYRECSAFQDMQVDPEAFHNNFTAEKEGYNPYNGSFAMEANKAISLPSINLKRLELNIESSIESRGSGREKTTSSDYIMF